MALAKRISPFFTEAETTHQLWFWRVMRQRPEAESFTGLPDAYVETAEFDCLHDEGIAYADALRNGGAQVTVNETAGTMHGFDIAENAPVSKSAVDARIRYMQSKFTPK